MKSIGKYAFEYCNSLTSVTIPNSVTEIGWAAFHGCSSLTSVTIPNSVTSIGVSAFADCSSLKSINVDKNNKNYSLSDGVLYNKNLTKLICCPGGKTSIAIQDSVTSIEDSAFYGCSNLTSVTIPNSVASIGEETFRHCSSLTSVTIPNSVTSIRDRAFYDCSSLRSVTISNSVMSIGHNAFGYCSSLTSVKIPDSVTSIGNYAFRSCSSLKSVTISNSVTSIGDHAFGNCSSLTSVTIPNSVTSIGDYAFIYCSSLTSVTIPNSVTSIGDHAFGNCSSLTSVTIPNSVTSIRDRAFYSCTSLTSVTIPKSVTEIGEEAFGYYYDKGYKKNNGFTIYSEKDSTAEKYANDNSFTFIVNGSEVTGIFLNKSSTTITKGNSETLTATITPSNATNKTVTWTTSNSSVATVSGGKVTAVAAGTATITAKSNNGKTATCTVTVTNSTVVEPTGITLSGTKNFNGVIEYGEWESDHNVVHATVNPSDATNKAVTWSVDNSSIIEIANTFSTDDGSSIIIHGKSAGKTSVTAKTSNGKTASWSIVVQGSSDEYCGPSVTYHLDSNGILTLKGTGDTWNYSDWSMFKNNNNIRKVIIEEGITSIGMFAFEGCSNLASIELPNSLTKIYSSAFSNTGISEITIPQNVDYLDDSALRYCYKLSSIIVNSNNQKYSSQDGVLLDKNKTHIIICPQGKTGYYVMPNSIGVSGSPSMPLFYYCNKLTDISLGENLNVDTWVRIYGLKREFIKCSSLVNLSCNENNINYTSVNGVLFSKDKKSLYLMPDARKGIYSVPDGTTSISTGAFINCNELSGLVIPESVTNIADKSIGYTGGFGDTPTIRDNISSFTIYGKSGSAAETYANNNGITFKNSSALVFPTSISLNSSSITKEVGSSSTITATVYPSNATDKTVIWLTNNPKVATVSNGKVTAVAVGTATITAVTNNGKTATCTVTVTNPTVEVTGITLNKTSTTITKGNSETLTATITPSNATNKTVTWTTSNSSVATVSSGKVTAVAAGTATITAKTYNNKTATCTVTVTNPTVEVTAISLNKTSTTITKGSSETLTATITPSNATNKTVTWTTSNSSVATVSSGKVTAVAAGTATITAKTNNNKTATCTVTVTNPTVEVTAISLNKTSTTITKGNSETLTATIAPSNATNKTVTWTTSNSSVATVSGGKVTAVAAGTATITAKTNNNKTATCTVTVTNPTVEVTGITLNKTSTTITKGSSETLTATITPSNATNKTVTWTTSNSSVATVSSGKVTAVAAGTATITAKTNNGKTATCKVTVIPKITAFEWGKDNWNFNNWSDYFPGRTYREQMNSEYLNKLASNLNNTDYNIVFVGSGSYKAWLDNEWGGSCYGMSATTFLSKEGLLPYNSYHNGATKLNDLNIFNDVNVRSLINYYQMLQVKDVTYLQFINTPKRSHKENIENILSLLNNHSTVMVGFRQDLTGIGHEILAYGCEYGSWTKNGVTYGGRIKICDPNRSSNEYANYEDSYIYFNTKTFSWTIPLYSGSYLVSSAYGAAFNHICANVMEINEGGYLSGTKNTVSYDYVARLDAYKISDNRSITKLKTDSNGSYMNTSANPDEIEESYSYIMRGEDKGIIGYNLYDAQSAYKVTQYNPVDMQLSLKYKDCMLYGGSAAGESVVFDNAGYVEVSGESADYQLGMVSNDYYPTDWFAVQVSGSNANEASLRKTDSGYVLSADNLKNIEIKANNKENSASIKFDTTYDKVLIYEINPTTIGLKVDTDNNGTFETTLDTTKSIKLNKTSISIGIGENFTLKATTDPASASVTWSSSNKDVATVTNGKVTGKKAGTATITATSGRVKATCTITVKAAPSSVSLNKTALTLGVGESFTLKATLLDNTASNTMTWTTSNSSIATVSSGKVTAKKVGTATITVKTFNGKTATCKITVKAAPSKVTLSKTALTLGVGESFTLKATLLDNTASNTMTWTTSNSSIATVSSGKVTAKKAGTATITVKTFNGKTATCKITVKAAPSKVTLSKTALTLGVGESFTLKATLPDNTASNTMTWTTSNSSIATVSSGKVTAKKAGTATITVKTFNGKTVTCKITVKTAPSKVTLSKTALSLGVGESFTLKATLPDNTASNTITWTTSNSSIATVSNGKVTAKKVGTATITVKTFNGKTATCKITVKAAPSSVSLPKTAITLGVGETYSMGAILPSDTAAATRTFSSSNSSVVKMTKTNWTGEFKAMKVGTAKVTVKIYNGKTATCTVTVKEAPTSVKLNKGNMTLKVGQKGTVSAVIPTNAGAASRTYRSSDSSIVQMTKTNWTGEFVAKKVGTAYVTVRLYNGKEASIKVTVVK